MNTSTSKIITVVNAAALALCTACSSAEPPARESGQTPPTAGNEASVVAANDRNVVLRLELDLAHTITFYEPAPGYLLMVESGPPGANLVLGTMDAPDPLEVFTTVKPGAEIPPELSAAYERALANVLASEDVVHEGAPAGGGAPSPVQASHAVQTEGDIGQAQQAHSTSSAADFVNTHGGCDWASAQSFCRVNWSNGFWCSWTSNSASARVDHYAGNGVTVRLQAGVAIQDFNHPVGLNTVYAWGLAAGNIVRRLDVLNASGDSFHVGCRWFL